MYSSKTRANFFFILNWCVAVIILTTIGNSYFLWLDYKLFTRVIDLFVGITIQLVFNKVFYESTNKVKTLVKPKLCIQWMLTMIRWNQNIIYFVITNKCVFIIESVF